MELQSKSVSQPDSGGGVIILQTRELDDRGVGKALTSQPPFVERCTHGEDPGNTQGVLLQVE